MPETSYQRNPVTPKKDDVMSQKSGDEEKPEVDVKEEAKEEASPIHIPRKKTYLEELVVFEGIRTTRVSFLTLILRPFIACLTPVCLWAGLVYGVAITWLVLIATAVAQIFSAPRKLTTRLMQWKSYCSPSLQF